jgi:hypothetical protein
MKKYKYAVLILSHGRAGNVKTLKTLKKHGYTGDWYIVVDDMDPTVQEYEDIYGKEKIVMFNKKEYANKTDTMDNFQDMRIVVYARNATFDIAESLGLDYFLVLDDDYTSFGFRRVREGKLVQIYAKQLDKLFDTMFDFLEVSGAKTVALAQGGDLIGGAQGWAGKGGIKRKAMNSFFCKTDRPFKFLGTINEDTNAYVRYGIIGELFLTIVEASLDQTNTQESDGGLTEIYLDQGTYVKSFYTVMLAPQSVKIRMMGNKFKRLHHHINWNKTVPKILNERYKKE